MWYSSVVSSARLSSPSLRGRAFAGTPTRHTVVRSIAGDDRVRAHQRASADRDRSEDLRARTDGDTVTDGRMPLATLALTAAERHPVVEHDIVAHLSGLADDDAHPVVDEEAAPDRRTRVDLDTGEPPGDL